MFILGITTGHNGSVTLMEDSQIIFHIEEERLSRSKRDSEPLLALDAIKGYTDTIDLLVISGTSAAAMTSYTNKPFQEAYLNKRGVGVLHTIDEGGYHHRLHAYNSFLNSGFDKALVVTIDGAGSSLGEGVFETETIAYMDRALEGEGVYEALFTNFVTQEYAEDVITDTYHVSTRPSIVKMFEGVTERIGYDVAEAGKTMGLSAYGKDDDTIKPFLDGDRGNKHFLPKYPAKTTMSAEEYGKFGGKIEDYEMSLAKMVQKDSEILCARLVDKAIALKPEVKNICISGGFGLNVLNNFQLIKNYPDITFWFEPTCNDAGNSIGAARMHSFLQLREAPAITDYCLGYQYDLKEVPGGFKFKGTTPGEVAKLISDNEIVAIYQGRSEAGPRALGNRSFMYNPTDPVGKDKMNTVKKREWFRPFAASVLTEYATDFFDMQNVKESPFMMIAFPTHENKQEEIPAVVHEDGSTRIQTVSEGSGRYREVIEEFHNITGIPMIMNTSFNLAGEPLVETPEEAFRTLHFADFNYIYFADNNTLVYKEKDEYE